MKNFLHIRDIPLKDLKKIISDAKNRKSKRLNLFYALNWGKEIL